MSLYVDSEMSYARGPSTPGVVDETRGTCCRMRNLLCRLGRHSGRRSPGPAATP